MNDAERRTLREAADALMADVTPANDVGVRRGRIGDSIRLKLASMPRVDHNGNPLPDPNPDPTPPGGAAQPAAA